MSCSTLIRSHRRDTLRRSQSTPVERKRAKASAVSAIAERHRSRLTPRVPENTVVERSAMEIRDVVQRLAKQDLKVSLELKAAVGMLYQVARLSELAAQHGNSAVAVSNLGAVTLHLETLCARWCSR